MKLGIIIYSDDAEVVWNAFRLGVFSLKKEDEVKVFLLAKGVECESLDTEKFKVTEMMQEFADLNGEIFACTSYFHIRNSEGTDLFPLSTMENLYNIINESDKLVSF